MTELELLAGQIAIPGIEVSLTGAAFIDPELTFTDWERFVRGAQLVHATAKWWIGDALNFGEGAYGERYAQAVEATGMNQHSLENIASVCRRVNRSRRREDLSFGHHEAVARLEPAQQIEWLEAANANSWALSEFRDKIREAVPPSPRGEQPSWSGAKPEPPEVLSLEQVESAEKLAQDTLKLTLPSGHPLWETQAKALAQDTLSLAVTAKASLHEALQRAIDEAQPYGEIGFWVTRATWQELVALVNEEGGTS